MSAKLGLSGGKKLREMLRDIRSKVKGDDFLRLGFLEGATYPDGTSVPFVAAVNEFGNPGHNQPPRPFFRNMIDAKSPAWGAQMAKLMHRTQCNPVVSLQYMGEGIKGQLQGSIRGFDSPQLAPSTVAAKGFAKPLIDSGVMLNSVDYEVKGG